MTEQKKMDVINLSKQVLKEKNDLREMAWYIGVEFEKKHGGNWNCLFGITEGYSCRYDFSS